MSNELNYNNISKLGIKLSTIGSYENDSHFDIKNNCAIMNQHCMNVNFCSISSYE
jgi:hypothetical protein